MDKVDKVLAAEEKARDIVAEARQRAAAIRSDADLAARARAADIATTVERDASADRDKVLAAAREGAAVLEDAASKALDAETAASRKRIDAVAGSLAGTLKG